jgi:hypothetical protein
MTREGESLQFFRSLLVEPVIIEKKLLAISLVVTVLPVVNVGAIVRSHVGFRLRQHQAHLGVQACGLPPVQERHQGH